MAGKFKKKVLPWITTGVLTLEALVNFGCKGNPISPDSPPYFTSSTPTAETTQTNIGNTHTVKGTAKDPDGDSINYKTLKDGTQVNNTNEYTFTIEEKGITRIDIVAYNALSDTLTKYFSANNQKPTAKDTSIVMDEESTTKIPESKLGNDADNDDLEYTITSTSTGISAKFENNQLEITGLQDYFGNANVNYNVSDGESNAAGTINLTINNTPDNPQANAGEDQNGTINQEITLDGSNSTHPDNPINNITQYLWRALNNEENININNADQKTATLKANTRGTYQIELTTTDNKNATDKDTTNITINSTMITGRILDTDTQEINTTLLAWVTANGTTDTTWTNNGIYQLETNPNNNLELKAGYKTQDKTTPKSFITTIKDINANNDQNNLDIAVVTYDNMNTTPEEFKIMMDEANFSARNLSTTGAKALRTDMAWYLTKKTDKYGQEFTTTEWNTVQEQVNIVNNYLNNPLPIILDYSGWYPETEAEKTGKITIVKRLDAGLASKGVIDYNNDGIVDHADIALMDPFNYPGSIREECIAVLTGFDFIRDEKLAGGKTILYETETIDLITDADIKATRLTETFTHQIGNYKPQKPIEEVLKEQ